MRVSERRRAGTVPGPSRRGIRDDLPRSIRTLRGLTSRCMIPREWRQSSAPSSWYKKYLISHRERWGEFSGRDASSPFSSSGDAISLPAPWQNHRAFRPAWRRTSVCEVVPRSDVRTTAPTIDARLISGRGRGCTTGRSPRSISSASPTPLSQPPSRPSSRGGDRWERTSISLRTFRSLTGFRHLSTTRSPVATSIASRTSLNLPLPRRRVMRKSSASRRREGGAEYEP
mmetsp:Transcript_41251/g.96743  ORF Transcript_41251/g.96743 Transcript_41251/m.96743 type:complete len:229 (-) Transcript_41251:410-1096(-)